VTPASRRALWHSRRATCSPGIAATPAVRRPYGRIGAFLITALLMFASFFTISSTSPAPT